MNNQFDCTIKLIVNNQTVNNQFDCTIKLIVNNQTVDNQFDFSQHIYLNTSCIHPLEQIFQINQTDSCH